MTLAPVVAGINTSAAAWTERQSSSLQYSMILRGEDADLSTFWLFMLWRLQSHGSIDQLTKDVVIAFPDLLPLLPDRDYHTPEKMLSILIKSRFIERFLEFWGFVTVEPRYFFSEKAAPRNVEIQPLLREAFRFNLAAPSSRI